MSKYYDGTKLLSLTDLRGEKPEIYIVTTNRTGGKTTFFSRLCVNAFKKRKEKFAILYRYKYELEDCASKFFKDINTLFFPEDVMTAKSVAGGVFCELYLNEIPCGYAIAINSAEAIKKYSHLLSDVKRIMFDEFQSENGNYCPNEVGKFMSIHTSIARGQGEQTRYVPVYMIGNPVSLLNPYYVKLGISTRLNSETKFLKGNGFVLEQGYVDSAAQAQKNSGFNRAFENEKYAAYSGAGIYLNDNPTFVGKPEGAGKYLGTLRYDGIDYGVKYYPDGGLMYCDDKPDLTSKMKIVINASDHDSDSVIVRSGDLFLSQLRYYFERGLFRFKNLQCKEALLHFLSY